MFDDDIFLWLGMILVFAFAFSFWMTMRRNRQNELSASNSASEKQQKTLAEKEQMVQDMKMTKTSRVVDEVAILDELGTTTSGYRQYCELIGTSMAESGVVAPYSQRPVAYYDVSCYRIERIGGRDVETLVAHENSIDPFYFTDDSCETPVYVDLASFKENVILVNSANHIEGPNSDFSQAFNKKAGITANSNTTPGFAIMGKVAEWASNVSSTFALPQLGLQPAYAGANGSAVDVEEYTRGPRLLRAQRRPGGVYGGFGYGGFGGQMPGGLGGFLGNGGGYGWGGTFGVPRPIPRSSSAGDMLTGVALGALLSTLNQSVNQSATGGNSNQGSFRGYRIVEDVVPLGSPIYCIGEIYRNGSDVYMGISRAKDYPTSFFACKPESEVISQLSS
ncbi:MAG: hypothetical protein IJ125_07955 [Atopobiaceae bacterium]|nr:hypothetical protein [Atopobiaceae bacterium]